MSIHRFLSPRAELLFEMEPVKGSRFHATLAPVSSAEEAMELVARVSATYSDATHNCWAWVVGSKGANFRSSDDGEPGGSAGRPILAQIEGHGATNTAVVVTRYYGGTKLGVGGLIRAYGGCAGKALDQADLDPVIIRRRLIVTHPYDCSGAVQGVLAAAEMTPTESEYGTDVRIVLEVPEEQLEAFKIELRERTAARALLEEPES
ncbi:MAG: putative YigZ family protein [Planctomycetota bacterium]|jgi:uncharacterized YigZ family protein